MAHVLRFILDGQGLTVKVPRDGAQAWQKAQAESSDVVIAEHHMPRLTGAELLARLREMPEYTTTPFVMATAKTVEMDMQHLEKQLQLAAVFEKPFSPAKLAATVDRGLRKCTALNLPDVAPFLGQPR